MCVTLYILSDKQLPTIPFDKTSPKVNTSDIAEDGGILDSIFKGRFIKSVGSDQGCACGFRFSMLCDNEWFDVLDNEDSEFDNSNHINLYEIIANHFEIGEFVEMLVCWNGDYNMPILHQETIYLSSILDKDFYFKERGLYKVLI